MTNGEKYKEVFGFEHPNCPTWYCPSCPVFKECSKPNILDYAAISNTWWNAEYKESEEEE